MSRIDRKFIMRLNKVTLGKGDEENWHLEADRILVEFLRKLSYDELAEAYEKIPKWYA